MRATTAKSVRDLRRQSAQVLAVAITIFLGVAIYVATAGAFQNLSASYQQTYTRLNFADLVATGGDPHAVAQAALEAGASAAMTRTQVDPPMLIDGTKLVGRVVSIPTNGHPAIDDVDVIEGAYLDAGATDQVLVEKHAAETFDLHPGDTIQFYGADGWVQMTIQGIVVSPEYIWAARSRQEVVADPHSFAVVFAPTDAVAAAFGPANQALALTSDDAADGKRDAVANAMREAGASSVTPWEDQASHATLNEDLKGFNEMSVAFPALFLVAAGVASYVLLARRILQEKPIIGTLMAAGAFRGRVLRHYLGQGLTIGLLGGVTGVGAGAALNGLVTTAYTGELGIPDTVVNNYPSMLVIGVAFGAVIGLLGALFPAISASRTAPAAAMRTAASVSSPGPWSRFVRRLTWLPATGRMALRDVSRSAKRTLATMLGAVLALVLTLASVGLMTSMVTLLHAQFHEVDTSDATVVVEAGADLSTITGDLRAVTGAERFAQGEVTVTSAAGSYPTAVRGYQPGTAMHGFISPSGDMVALPADGVLIDIAMNGILDVEPGDTVTLSTVAGDRDVRVAGLVDEPLGSYVYSQLDLAQQILPAADVDSYALTFAEGADRDALRRHITGADAVVAYTDNKALLHVVDQFLGLFWAFIGVMIALGAVLALAVMYVTMAVNVVERTGELATLRAAGVPLRRVAGAIAAENLLATLLGIPFGLVAGVIAARAFLESFSSDLFTLHLTWQWWVLPAAALGVLLAAAVSQWPAARAIRRVDIAKVVRERAA